METTIQQQRSRRFLLVAPMLVLPFLSLLFWTLGGGRAAAENNSAGNMHGFNSRLPDARIRNDGGESKLSYYDRAAADSEKLRQDAQADPYAKKHADSSSSGMGFSGTAFSAHQPPIFEAGGNPGDNDPAAKTVQIRQRLKELQTLINKPAQAPGVDPVNNMAASQPSPPPVQTAVVPPPVTTTADPELNQMNGLLEKILDIQHPERVRERAKAGDSAAPAEEFRAIPAEVDGNQKIVQGTVIRIRLLDSARLNGHLFEKGQLIYGNGDLYNQRVRINIRLIHVGLQIIPVNLTVYDRTDGLEGISVPEAVTGDAVKDGAVSGVQNMEMMSFDPSMSAQLATAGLNTAKGLFSKKMKRVKGKLKGGHQLLLRINQKNQS